MRHFICGLMVLCLSGCMRLTLDGCPVPLEPPREGIERGDYFLRRQDYKQALETFKNILEKDPQNEEACYQIGRIYGLMGEFEKSAEYYSKALGIKSNYHAAYVSLKTLHKLKLIELQAEIEQTRTNMVQSKRKGEEVKAIQKKLDNLYRERARVYLEEANTYLLYEDPKSNVPDFPGIEAHLRDTQDTIKETEESRAQERTPEKKKIEDPIFLEIKDMRSKLSKKHAAMLMVLGNEAAAQGDVFKAIDYLRDADAQMSKFFEEEDPTSQFSLLSQNDEVVILSKNIVQHLSRYYESVLQIHLKTRKNFSDIGEWQQAEDETKMLEQVLESLIQLKLHSLWRFEKLKKTEAEEHPDLVPLYEQLLNYVSDSQRSGDYYFSLARCYARKGEHEKALMFGKKAQEKLGAYKVKEFLQEIEKYKTKSDQSSE